MTHQDHTSLKDSVLASIQEGKILMRPRLHTLLYIAVTLLVAVGVLVLSSLIMSFIGYSLIESGKSSLLGFGTRGFVTFLVLFPWTLLLVDIVAIFALRFLLGGFGFVYRRSFVTVLSLLLAISFLLALGILLTPLHSELHDRADRDDLPVFNTLYREVHEPNERSGEFRGVIFELYEDSLMLGHDDHDRDGDDGVRKVIFEDAVDLSPYQVGDLIYVAGELEDGVIEAYGIHRLESVEHREEDEE